MIRLVALALGLALVACGGGTSLEGPTDCAGQPCTSGQVCQHIAGGIDAGPGGGGGNGASYCLDVPGDCELHDCMGGGCSPCINKLCYPTGAVQLSGRNLDCQGQ